MCETIYCITKLVVPDTTGVVGVVIGGNGRHGNNVCPTIGE